MIWVNVVSIHRLRSQVAGKRGDKESIRVSSCRIGLCSGSPLLFVETEGEYRLVKWLVIELLFCILPFIVLLYSDACLL